MKELVFNTTTFLRNKKAQNLSKTFWKDLPIETQIRIKDVLLKNKFIQLPNDHPFTFKITTEGHFAKLEDLDEDGYLLDFPCLNPKNQAIRSPIKTAIKEVWKFINNNTIVSALISGLILAANYKFNIAFCANQADRQNTVQNTIDSSTSCALSDNARYQFNKAREQKTLTLRPLSPFPSISSFALLLCFAKNRKFLKAFLSLKKLSNFFIVQIYKLL